MGCIAGILGALQAFGVPAGEPLDIMADDQGQRERERGREIMRMNLTKKLLSGISTANKTATVQLVQSEVRFRCRVRCKLGTCTALCKLCVGWRKFLPAYALCVCVFVPVRMGVMALVWKFV